MILKSKSISRKVKPSKIFSHTWRLVLFGLDTHISIQTKVVKTKILAQIGGRGEHVKCVIVKSILSKIQNFII